MVKDNQKSKVLDWLSSLVNHTFIHHFSDAWINVNIWDNVLSISFDFRQPNQVELFNKLPKEIKGCLQRSTGKLVNETSLYFKVSDICKFEYPRIVSSKLIRREKHQSGSGGWIDVGKYFYTYDWELTLSDNTTIQYHNQVDKMDLKETDIVYRTKIEEKEFWAYINSKTYDKS